MRGEWQNSRAEGQNHARKGKVCSGNAKLARQAKLARRKPGVARGKENLLGGTSSSLGERRSLGEEWRNSRAAGKAPPFEFLPLLSTCPIGFLLPLGSPLLGFLHPLLLFSLTSSTPWISATYWFSIPLLLPIGFLTTLFLIRDIAAFKATCASFQFSSAPAPFPPCPLPQEKAKNFHSLPL